MDLDIDNLFGDIEAQNVGGSDGENDTDQQHQRNYGEEEQRETNDAETTGETKAPETIKVKRVMNPLPKLDAQRLTGPRGMFALHKTFRNFKFKGKGHEREDLQILLKMMEHWAHRLYPKLPFKDTLEQIEKLGAKKNIQVNMKKFRLDMMGENEDEDDNVRRGPDNENSETTPVVDVFDELLGIASDQPTTTTITNNDINTTIPPQTTVLPGSQSPKRSTMTPEQRERMERNRRLAIEKRLARMKEQQEKQRLEQEQDKLESAGQERTASQVVDYFDNLQGTGRLLGTQEDTEEKLLETEAITDKLEDSEETPDVPEALSEPQAPGETLTSQEDKSGHETEEIPFAQRLDEDTQASVEALTTQKDNNGAAQEREDSLEPLHEMEVELPHNKNDLKQVPGEDSVMEEV